MLGRPSFGSAANRSSKDLIPGMDKCLAVH